MRRRLIYADYNATNPLPPKHAEQVANILESNFGNPSSTHGAGRAARLLVEETRDTVATMLGCERQEIYFNSGATEANNQAIFGFVSSWDGLKAPRLACSAGDHASLVNPMKFLATKRKVEFIPIPLNAQGTLTEKEVASINANEIDFISLVHANSETGALVELDSIVTMLRSANSKVHIHVDAVQSAGKLDLAWIGKSPIDTVSISGHKMGAFKGIGCLYQKRGLAITPLIHGGSQERLHRAGTENMPGIISLGLRLRSVLSSPERLAPLAELSSSFHRRLLAIDGTVRNGDPSVCLATTVNVSFPQFLSAEVLVALDLAGVCASSGSACSSGSSQPSRALLAMGKSPKLAESAVRFSFGEYTTEEDLDAIIEALYNLARSKGVAIAP